MFVTVKQPTKHCTCTQCLACFGSFQNNACFKLVCNVILRSTEERKRPCGCGQLAFCLLVDFIFSCRRKILSPRFSPPLQRKDGVDQSTASFVEPMRPSTSQGIVMATTQQKQVSEDEDNESGDEVSYNW